MQLLHFYLTFIGNDSVKNPVSKYINRKHGGYICHCLKEISKHTVLQTLLAPQKKISLITLKLAIGIQYHIPARLDVLHTIFKNGMQLQ